MALVVDLVGAIDSTSGQVSCNLEGAGVVCPQSSLLSQTVAYANNNRLWLQDYHSAFIKMTNTKISHTWFASQTGPIAL